MPLYEYHCPPCDIVFEELCSLGEAKTKKPCPDCGRKAPRIVSSFAISHSVSGEPYDPVTASRKNARDPRPLCMQHSQIPLSCHMDEYSVKRFAAHAAGKGNAFEDSVAQAKEVRKRRGLKQPTYAPATHGHDHDHDHGHAHSHDTNFRLHGHAQAEGQSHDHAHSHHHGQGKPRKKQPAHAH